ncbi:MAG: class I SAM-dependent RNA methyltransferase, partial [Rhodospirillales bacterium]|nr:class I SAM-dependent RNA methyltransferase [Rhodospirillales bacterium]
VAPVVRIPAGTRRRAMFSFSRKRQTLVLGFAARASHTLVDVTECPLLKPDLMAALPTLRALLAEVVDNGVDGDVTVTLTENGLDVLVEAEARLDLFARERLGAFAEARDLARLSWRRPGTGMIEPLARRRPALVLFDGVAVEPPPGTFLQPSVEGEQAIARLVGEAVAELSPVADLFSGCGSFTLPLARSAIVHAVEGEEGALRALKIAADHARRRVTVETRDLSRRPLLAPELKRFEAVVFDPPRAGAAAQAEMLAQGGPGCVVAVSCNPATLARDARTLLDGGYGLERVVPIDQFPWAAHLEAVAVFRRG